MPDFNPQKSVWGWSLILCLGLISFARSEEPKPVERHLLYVAAPGIRDDLQFGGAGILVFDMDRNFAWLKRIETPAIRETKPDNMKGICACAGTSKLYFSTPRKLYCLDLKTEQTLWEKALPGGCDRMSMTADGQLLYVPSFEGPHWNIVDGGTGEVVAKVETKSGSHNTVCSLDGSRAYMAGLRSPMLTVVDTKTQKPVGQIGPFSSAIRPFTVNGAKTLCVVNVNGLLGFEIGDLTTGKKVYRVEVKDYKQGPTKRHGCPSHGVGFTPDEKEIWVCDAANSRVHVFDATVMPPRQTTSIALREQPGWITFSIDGRFALPSTGEVIDTASKKIVAALRDEQGREVHSEKMLEIDFKNGMPIRAGDQFGLGRQQIGSEK
jgi:DNA-binding beta-propeller fold protein YncE